MAYHSTSGIATNTADLLVALKNFLVDTVGWTLHDDGSSDTDPYYVFKSYGETGSEDIYLRYIDDSGSNRIFVEAYQYWNASTHTGLNVASNWTYTCVKTLDSSQFIYWLYGDLDHLFVVTKISSSYYGQYAGLINRFWSGAVALTQSAVSPGSDVVIPVSDASILQEAYYYLIKDDGGIGRIQVSSRDTVSTPNTITVYTLGQSFGAGAKIGEDPQPVITGYYNSPSSFYAVNRYDGSTLNGGFTGRCGAANGGLQGDCDPEFRYGRTVLFPWLVSHNAPDNQELRGELIEVYSIGSGNVDVEDTLEIGSDTYKVFNLNGPGWCAVKE